MRFFAHRARCIEKTTKPSATPNPLITPLLSQFTRIILKVHTKVTHIVHPSWIELTSIASNQEDRQAAQRFSSSSENATKNIFHTKMAKRQQEKDTCVGGIPAKNTKIKYQKYVDLAGSEDAVSSLLQGRYNFFPSASSFWRRAFINVQSYLPSRFG